MRDEQQIVGVELDDFQPPSEALAYSGCMRLHGVSRFPDPTSGGQIDKTKEIPLEHSPEFRVAEGACRPLLPSHATQSGPTHAHVQAALSGMVAFAGCMRSHAVGNWPDPYVDRSSPRDPRPVFELHASINPDAPGIRADIRSCQHLMPGSTSPYMCSTAAAPPGSGPGDEGCTGGSATVP
jgi:hypothetical protein